LRLVHGMLIYDFSPSARFILYSQILSISQASHLEYTWIGFEVVVLSLGRILRASYIERNGIYICWIRLVCVCAQCLPMLEFAIRCYLCCFNMCSVL